MKYLFLMLLLVANSSWAGDAVPINPVEKFAYFLEKAGDGNAKAQTVLGGLYTTGDGAPQNHVKATYWYQQSAYQGNALAQYFLGVAYYEGKGVTQDPAESAHWFRKSAEQGDAAAQLMLGIMYATGDGVAKDNIEAVRWYLKSAEQGEAMAQNHLGIMHYKGLGIPQDVVQSYKWFSIAAEGGDKDGAENLTKVARVMTPNQVAEAQKLVREWLAHTVTEGIPTDPAERFAYYQEKANEGEAEAQYVLGAMYAEGQGVPKNSTEAVHWYRKAADQGLTKAYDSIVLMFAQGESLPQDFIDEMIGFIKSKNITERRATLESIVGNTNKYLPSTNFNIRTDYASAHDDRITYHKTMLAGSSDEFDKVSLMKLKPGYIKEVCKGPARFFLAAGIAIEMKFNANDGILIFETIIKPNSCDLNPRINSTSLITNYNTKPKEIGANDISYIEKCLSIKKPYMKSNELYVYYFDNAIANCGNQANDRLKKISANTTEYFVFDRLSDHGIKSINKQTGGYFIVQTGYATHKRNYQLNTYNKTIKYFGDGEEVTLGKGKLITKKGVKGYFNGGGAFWFDAVFDSEGFITSISPEAGTTGIKCFSKEDPKISSINLTRYKLKTLCVTQ